MKLYKIRYFDDNEWGWVEKTIIATDEDSVIDFVNKQCSPEKRLVKLSSSSQEPVDSLSIKEVLEINRAMDISDLTSY